MVVLIDCDVSQLMNSLQIPTGFLGETTDATGSFQACAPEADNFTTFYGNANPPSFAVTVLGANHMSFLDDPSACGLVCSFCKPATAGATDPGRACGTADRNNALSMNTGCSGRSASTVVSAPPSMR